MAASVMFAVCVWSGVVMLKNHSMSSTHPGVFAGLLPPDGEIVDNIVQQ
jgi:hypothetical protein